MTWFRDVRAHSGMSLFVAGALALWLALTCFLGASGSFVRPPGVPPLPILVGATLPLLVFVGAWLASEAFRYFVLDADLRLLTALQAWRAGGLGFLALHTHGALAGLFAWLAGLGDVAIGVTAPWVALALVRQPSFFASRAFAMWNLLGVLDLVVAVSSGVLSTGFLGVFTGSDTTATMTKLPLVLVPAYLVPLFLMLHFAALLQWRRYAPLAPLAQEVCRLIDPVEGRPGRDDVERGRAPTPAEQWSAPATRAARVSW